MAGFHTKTFIKHDDYMTPNSAWDAIKEYIPQDKVIWEAFYGDGKSGDYLKELGFNVIHEPIDFFDSNEGDIIVSNPPFSMVKQIMPRMLELDKPFILLMPCSKLCAGYFRPWKDKNIQLLIPEKRIQFTKHINGVPPPNWRSSPNFDCFYYCYKMNLDNDITML